MNPASIAVSTRIVGKVRLESNRVRGEGGPWEPAIILPISMELNPTPENSMLLIPWMSATLHLSNSPHPSQIGNPVRVDLIPGMNARSLPDSVSHHALDLRVPLSPGGIARLEAARHQAPDKSPRVLLKIEMAICWMKDEARSLPPEQQPLGGRIGLVSSLWHLWTVNVDDLDDTIPASVWVDKVLPGLGLTNSRLIEIRLPVGVTGLPAGTLTAFDEARRDLDLGHYRECVQKCRDVRTMIEKHLKATKARPVDQVVIETVGLAPESAEAALLREWWKGLVDATSSAHHSKLSVSREHAAAELVLYGTSLLLQFLDRILRP